MGRTGNSWYNSNTNECVAQVKRLAFSTTRANGLHMAQSLPVCKTPPGSQAHRGSRQCPITMEKKKMWGQGRGGARTSPGWNSVALNASLLELHPYKWPSVNS